MQTRREFLSTTGLVAASSSLVLMNTGCIGIQESSLQDKFADNFSSDNKSQASISFNHTSDNNIRHTLRRISFGVKNQDLSRVNAIGLDAYIEEQLNPETIQDSETENYITNTYPRLLMTGSELLQKEGFKAHNDLKKATIYRMINSNRQLKEVMVDFWSNHFNIDGRLGILDRYKSIDDREVIRQHALGNFRDLLHASAKSPAMLKYLNNDTNTKSGPNENYARELMELHTLGIDGGYTEKDIKESARCLTGWSINKSEISFEFLSSKHDDEEKSVLGNIIPAGQGVEDAEQVLDILLDMPATARHIAKKLVIRFVDDNPPSSLVDKVAATFTSMNADIPSMLRVIFYSEEFKNSSYTKFKRPVEYIASVYRTLGIDTTTFTHPKAQTTLETLGQTLFEWPTPDGCPETLHYWNSTQGLATRWAFALKISEVVFNPRNIYLTDWLQTITTADSLIGQFSNRILKHELSSQDKESLLLLITENNYKPDEELDDSQIINAASNVTAALLSMPAFMYR